MTLPTYTITNLLVDYLVRYELALERIKTTPLTYIHKSELEGAMLMEEIQALGELIGNSIGVHQAEQVQKGKVLPSSRKQLMIFSNYRNALEFAKSYSSESSIMPSSELLIHLNRLVMNKILEEWEVGKIRTFSERPNEIYDNWYKIRDFYPNTDLIRHFNEIFQWMNNPSNSVHKLIQLAVFLFEMIDKSPLFGGNQITAIAALTAISKDAGYNPDVMLGFAKAINFINYDLFNAFKLSKSKKDLTMFIEAFLYSASLQMLHLEERYLSVFNEKVKGHGKLRDRFNFRQIRILEYLDNMTKVTRNEYRKMMGISFMTAYRDLQQLVNEGFVECKGVGRGTYYEIIRKAPPEPEKRTIPVFGEL